MFGKKWLAVSVTGCHFGIHMSMYIKISVRVEVVVKQHKICRTNESLKRNHPGPSKMEFLDTKQMSCINTEKIPRMFPSSSRQIFSFELFFYPVAIKKAN